MDKQLTLKMDEYLAKNKEEIIQSIIELSKYPSVMSEPAPGAPYGKACRECLDASAKVMKDGGFEISFNKDGKYAVASFGTGEKAIGLFAHTDVVPVTESDWVYTKPFEPKRIGDVLIGRGVEDDKSAIAISLHAIKMLCEAGLAPKSRIDVFLGSNEETGMEDIIAYAAENKMPDVSLVIDNDFPVCYGEKGIFRADVLFEKPFEDITEFRGGSAYNIMLDTLNVKIKYSDKLFEEITGISKNNNRISVEKSGDTIKVTATGIASHAAHPDGGLNAASVFCKALASCDALCENDREILGRIDALTSGFYGENLGISCSDEYFGKLTCANGICSLENGVPHISLDIRYGVNITGDEIRNKILAYFPASKFPEDKPGFAIPKDDKFAKILENAYIEISGDKEAKGFYSGGGTYARYLRNAFSVGTQAMYVPNDTPKLPEGHGAAHQSDELLRINSMLEAIKIIALMILRCDEELNFQN